MRRKGKVYNLPYLINISLCSIKDCAKKNLQQANLFNINN